MGLIDTTLIHPTERFPYGAYEGGKPFFVQIWYPAGQQPAGNGMPLGDLLRFSGRERVSALHDSTMTLWRQIIVRDGLTPDRRLGLDEKPVWPEDSLQLMLSLLLQQPLDIYRDAAPAGGRFPLVIYHHGAQSMPFENHLLFEHLASRGFVVVASSYNLANELIPDMLLRSLEGAEADQDLLFMLEFARSLPFVDTNRVYGLGFSAGAQALLQLDMRPEPKPFGAIICLHTTLEDKSVALINEKGWWEDLQPIINGEAVHATTASWVLAPLNRYVTQTQASDVFATSQQVTLRYKAPAFEAFRANGKYTPYRFVTVQYPLSHDGFITMGNWRYLIRDHFNFPDRREMAQEYRAHLMVNERVTRILEWLARGGNPDEEWMNFPLLIEKP